jgi:hypothetical protein
MKLAWNASCVALGLTALTSSSQGGQRVGVYIYGQPGVVYRQPTIVYRQPAVVYRQPSVAYVYYSQPAVVYRQPAVLYTYPQPGVVYSGYSHPQQVGTAYPTPAVQPPQDQQLVPAVAPSGYVRPSVLNSPVEPATPVPQPLHEEQQRVPAVTPSRNIYPSPSTPEPAPVAPPVPAKAGLENDDSVKTQGKSDPLSQPKDDLTKLKRGMEEFGRHSRDPQPTLP